MPDPPRGTVITARAVPEGTRLSWPGQPRGQRMKWLVLSVVLLCAGFAASALCAMWAVAEPKEPNGWLLLAISLAVFSAGVLACFRYYDLTHENLILRRDSLEFTPCMKTSEAAELLTWDDEGIWRGFGLSRMFTTFRRKKSTRLSRSKVLSVAVEGRGRYAHVVVTVGHDRLEMGRFLRQAEREWLAGVLRERHGAHGA